MRSAPGAEADVVVIGAGVNGLVCAALLAQAKRRVILLEALDHVGGACTTTDLVAGHRISTFAHLVGPLDAALMKTLRLQRFGLQFSAKKVATIALSPDARHVVLDGDLRHTAQTLALHSASDAKAWPQFDGRLRKAAKQLERWVQTPPGGPFDAARNKPSTARAAAKAGGLDAEMAAFLDGSVGDLLDAEFESPLVKGALAFDAVLGSGLGPRSHGTALLAALRLALDSETTDGLAHPQGGAGAVTGALAKAAEAAGVRIRLKSRVAHLLFDFDRVVGVELANGAAIYAPIVVSSLDAKTTLIGLGGERYLPLGLKRRLRGLRVEGCVSKVNLALGNLPTFKGLDRKALKERLIICPSMEHLERAFAAHEQGAFSPDPAMEIIIPSMHDTTLATAGHHVLSANVLYTPYRLASGSWDDAKKALVARVGAALRQYAPDLPDLILAADVYTPPEIEAFAGSPGGHWHGGDLALDRLGPLRPLSALGRYETPIAGVYLCGAGTHPCGGVTGVNGRNAAEAVLAVASAPGMA